MSTPDLPSEAEQGSSVEETAAEDVEKRLGKVTRELRTLLLVVLMSSLPVGYFTWQMNREARQAGKEAQQLLKKMTEPAEKKKAVSEQID